MSDKLQKENDDCTRLSNRSCKTKLHQDSVSELITTGLKLRLTKSQKELELIEGVMELEAIEMEWEKKEARIRQNSYQKEESPKDKGQHQREEEKNTLKKLPFSKRGLNFETEIIKSEEISLDDDAKSQKIQQRQSQRSQQEQNRSIKMERQAEKDQKPRELKLNVLLFGKSGNGKTSFVDCFCEKYKPNQPIIRERTCQTEISIIKREKENVKVEIALIDMPGFHDVDAEAYRREIARFISQRFKRRLSVSSDKNAMPIKEQEVDDERIHCCLYFLAGPWIDEADWLNMKKIDRITSIIPIISKGDCLTINELNEFKKKIYTKKNEYDINWFSVQEILKHHYPDQIDKLVNGAAGKSPPFLVICCNERQLNNETGVYEMVREYKWGRCQLDNAGHNDFGFLKELLLDYLGDYLVESTDLLEKSFLEVRNQRDPIKEEASLEEEQSLKSFRTSSHPFENYSQESDFSEDNRQFGTIKQIVALGMTFIGILGVMGMMRNQKP